MKPGDIMNVFSLGAAATARRPGISGISGSRKQHQASHPRAGSGTATSETARARWPDQDRSNRTIGSGPAVRNRLGESVFVCQRDGRVHHGACCGSPAGTLRVDATTSESSERNRAIGAHFPDVADIAAAAALAARLAVRFKPLSRRFRLESRLESLAPVVFPAGNDRPNWDHGLARRFGSIDEVCRPRLGFDANINRDVTLL